MLHGQHIYLRHIAKADLRLRVKWRNDPDIAKNFSNKAPLTLGEQKKWIGEHNADPSSQLFIICLNGSGKPIGTIGYKKLDELSRDVEYGNLLIGEKEFLGMGYAREATELLTRYLLAKRGMNRIFLTVFSGNDRAISLYRKFGFKAEGTVVNDNKEGKKTEEMLLMRLSNDDHTTPPI